MHTPTPPSPMGLSLHTSFSSSPPNSASYSDSYARSDCSTVSPLSSAATSPASSPTSPFQRLCRPTSSWKFTTKTQHINNITTTHNNSDNTHGSQNESRTRSRSQSPFHLHLPTTLRRSSLLLFLRRRPSKVDLALSEERSRCDEDAIERQGLGLMEPRPVDPIDPVIGEQKCEPGRGGGFGLGSRSSMQSLSISGCLSPSTPAQPRFVMGGIEEVMKGEA